MIAPFAVAALFGAGLWLVATGLPWMQRRPDLATQLRRLSAQGRMELEAAQRNQGPAVFASATLERVLRPIIEDTGDLLRRLLSRVGVASPDLERRLATGWPGTTTAQFFGQKLAIGLLFFAFFPAMNLAGLHPFGPWPVWIWLLGFVLGFFQPDWLLERRIARRRKAILVELPTVLDLLAMAASAGLSPEQALADVSRQVRGALGDGLRVVAREASLGTATHPEGLRARSATRLLVPPLLAFAAGQAARGPCDIYKDGGTPCVAAHSMVRALYGAYAGNLYQVKRAKDSATADVGVLSAGGFANAKTQDDFCAGTTCTVSILYDQSGKGNHLTSAPGGSANKTPGKRVVANDAPLKVNGISVYGAKFKGGQGYRNIKTNGVATGDNPESMYMVVNGKNYNSQCCFDYGNAETTSNDDGEGTMEAIYFGNSTSWGKGAGTGPWIMADIENGLWAGATSPNNNAPSINANYVTGMVKGKPHTFAVKWGDAAAGGLNTYWEGAYPAKGAWGIKYDPMRKQGAIILGIGGDNSNWAVGTWYEGAMTTGYATDSVDKAVQANIAAAGYGSATTTLARGTRVESSTSLHFDPRGATTRLSFTLEQATHVRLRAMDPQGREVARLVDGTVASGSHAATWDASRVRAGIYALVLETGAGERWSGKVLVGR